jgi:hypothetical protein
MDFCLNNYETRQWIRVVRDDTLYQYTQLRTKWLQNRSPNEKVHEDQKVSPAQQQEWMDFLTSRFPKFVQVAQAYEFTNTEMPLERHVLSVKQKARNHKASIITWMVFWPWSLTWWLIRDFVKKIGLRLYNLVAKWLDKISDWVYQGVDEDFNTIGSFTNVKTITLENKDGDTSREVNVK